MLGGKQRDSGATSLGVLEFDQSLNRRASIYTSQ